MMVVKTRRILVEIMIIMNSKLLYSRIPDTVNGVPSCCYVREAAVHGMITERIQKDAEGSGRILV